MEEENTIRLRSEKARHVIGRMPKLLVWTGRAVILVVIIVIAACAAACAWLIKDNGTPLINLIFAYI